MWVRWMRAVASAGAAATLAGCTGEPSCTADHCPAGTGSVVALDASGAEVWRTVIEDRSNVPPLVSGDFVVVDGCRAVHVLEADTGQLIRSTEELADTVGVLADRVYGAERLDAAGKGSSVGVRGVALDDTGSERSISHAGNDDGPGFARTLAIGHQRLMGTQGDRLIVYPGEGASAAQVQLPVVPETRVLPVGNNRAVVGASDGSVVGVDLAALKLAWRVVPEQVSQQFTLGLRAVGRRVLVSALGSAPTGPGQAGDPVDEVAETMALSADDGSVAWRRTGFVVGAATETVAVLLGDSTIVALDLRTGRELWNRAAPSLDRSELASAVSRQPGQSVAAVDGSVTLVAPTSSGTATTLALDASTGRELWTLDGHLGPVALEGTFAFTRRSADRRGTVVDVVDPRAGRVLWSASWGAGRSGHSRPEAHLSSDPARSQTIVLDLPDIPSGGC